MVATLLPDPDSPTMPSVLPRARSNDSPSTALTTPSSVRKCTVRSRMERMAPRSAMWRSRSGSICVVIAASLADR